MNIPEIYLIEPYNAYTNQKGGRKKHWHEVVEEQALLQRIIAEQQALQEAQSNTLPQNAPHVSTPVVGHAAGAGAGAGGTPILRFFGPDFFSGTGSSFTADITTGAGPLTVNFSNGTTPQVNDIFLWTFGDGTTSSLANPLPHLYDSGSSATNTYTCSLQVTFSGGPITASLTKLGYISASKPVVSASFTFTTSSISGSISGSNTAGSTASFINTSVNTSQTQIPATSYRWTFSSGSVTSIFLTSVPGQVTASFSGSWTASLQATGSYSNSSSMTRFWSLG